MRDINNMDLIQDASIAFNNLIKRMKNEEDLNQVKKLGNYGLGMIEGLSLTLDAMICTENNGFTGDFDDWLTKKQECIRRIVHIKELEDEAKKTNGHEDKIQICKKLCEALQLTRCCSDLKSIDYEADSETVVLHFGDHGVVRVNAALDSGVAIIRDIMKHID